MSLLSDDVLIAKEQRNAALSQYFDGYSRIVDQGPCGLCILIARGPVQI
jgi:hypothetical protein